MGLDFDLEEGNIKGVKEEPKQGKGSGIKVAAIVVIVILAALLLFFVSNSSTLYGVLPAFGSSFTPITTSGSDANNTGNGLGNSAGTAGGSQNAPAIGSGQGDSRISSATGKTEETANESQAIDSNAFAFNSQFVSGDYSLQVSGTDIEIEGRISGTTQSESFPFLAGSYKLKNFSGRIRASKGFVQIEGNSDELSTPIGPMKIKGEMSVSLESGILAMNSVYLNSFSQNATGKVSTSTTSIDAYGPLTLNGFKGKITLGMNNAVTFEGKTLKYVVRTTSGTTVTMDISTAPQASAS